jgi:hypothetical protein
MSYLQTVSEIRAAAIHVNPNGTFDHGGHVDISQDFAKSTPFIYLYPISITPGIEPNFIDNNTVLIGFWQQDKPHSSTEEREETLSEMDILSTAFINQLKDNNYVSVTNVRKEPVYKHYQGHFSGFLVQFTYQNFTPC